MTKRELMKKDVGKEDFQKLKLKKQETAEDEGRTKVHNEETAPTLRESNGGNRYE